MRQFYLILFLLSCSVLPSFAQEKCYKRFCEEGKAHFKNGKYVDAKKSFDQANDCPGRPKSWTEADDYIARIAKLTRPSEPHPIVKLIPPSEPHPTIKNNTTADPIVVKPTVGTPQVRTPERSVPDTASVQTPPKNIHSSETDTKINVSTKATEDIRKKLREDSLWEYVNDLRTIYAYNYFKQKYPNSQRNTKADEYIKNVALSKPPKPSTILIKKQVVNFPTSSTDLSPVHTVSLGQKYVGVCEVTNAEYCIFLNEKGDSSANGLCYIKLSGAQGGEFCRIRKKGLKFEVQAGYEDLPVIFVSWYGADAYCKWMNTKYPLSYALPSEALLEYVGHIHAPNGRPITVNDMIKQVNSKDPNDSHPGLATCKSFSKNDQGLYHVLGNVAEWCMDNWAEEVKSLPSDGTPYTKGNPAEKVVRGGAWNQIMQNCYPLNRLAATAAEGYPFIGFRIVSEMP